MSLPLRALMTLPRNAFRYNYGTQVCHKLFSTFNVSHTLNLNGLRSAINSNSILQQQKRNVSFMNTISATSIWDGTTGVSSAGRKKGRGKGRKKVTNLNRGQVMGVGRENMQWPGLNSPILKDRKVEQVKKLPPNPDYEANLKQARDKSAKTGIQNTPPLVRGYVGSRAPGQSIGPPDPLEDYSFEGFDSCILDLRMVTNMTGTLGRKMSFSAFVAVGNKKGVAGYGKGKSQTAKGALRKAKNSAAQHLFFIERFQDRTVYHNMFAHYKRTKVFINKKPPGYGLVCHRVLKSLCGLIGIEDIYCKVEGSTKNVRCITKGFFDALSKQELHSDLAERMGYHVVERRPEREYLPVVLASPSGPTQTETYRDEEEDLEVRFDRLYYGGKQQLIKPPPRPLFWNHKSWAKKQARMRVLRNQPKVQQLKLAGVMEQ